jgi:hypothetical protein
MVRSVNLGIGVSFVALWLLVTVMGPIGAASSNTGSPFARFPLWKDIEGPFATLDEGHLPDGTRWAVFGSRAVGKSWGRREPCVTVARITRFGDYAHANGCGPLSPEGPNRPPVYVSISGAYEKHPDGPVVGEAFMGLTFKRTVRRVTLLFSDGGRLTRPTRLLNPKQSRKTGLVRFSYLALGMQRDVCVSTVIGYDQFSTALFSLPTMTCPSDYRLRR